MPHTAWVSGTQVAEGHTSRQMTFERSASGKVILCGEHSVVYGRPAIAVPVAGLRCRAWVEAAAPGTGLRLVAEDLGESLRLRDAPSDHPLALLARLTLAQVRCAEPDAVLTVRSELPIAAGLGSGAAVSVAAARALSGFLGHTLPAQTVSALAYEVEKLHHGTPSGIDNTVIAFERPVYFVKGQPPEVLTLSAPLRLLIADSGVAASTREAVAGVRRRREADVATSDAHFDRIGALVKAARVALETQDLPALGDLLNVNHGILQQLGVSTPLLDALVDAARNAGALGAKLTGGGIGGNIIALVSAESASSVAEALFASGARHVWRTFTA